MCGQRTTDIQQGEMITRKIEQIRICYMELNLMVKKNEQLRSQQIQKVTIFRQERILKNNPEQKDHTQVDFQGNFININTSNHQF